MGWSGGVGPMPGKRAQLDISIVVGIPTVGRSAVLCETLRELARQTRPPDRIAVCGTSRNDVDGVAAVAPQALILQTEAGLPRQRNAILDAAGAADVVVFFDDDFLPQPDYLQAVAQHMTSHPKTVVATGVVLADGIKGPGLSPAQARTIIAHDSLAHAAVAPVFSGYGCNMAVRLRRCARMTCASTNACRYMPGRRMSISPAGWLPSATSCASVLPGACIWGSRPAADRGCGSAIPRYANPST